MQRSALHSSLIINLDTFSNLLGCLAGNNLPPELVERGDNRFSALPNCSEAESAGIASIHPDYENDSRETEEGATVVRGPESTFTFSKLPWGKRISEPEYIEKLEERQEGEQPSGPSLYNGSSGHKDIQNLAEHYRGRSR